MSRNWLIIACAFGSLAFMRADAAERTPQPAPPVQANTPAATLEARAEVRRAGIWQPPPGLRQIPIWPNGAPDMSGPAEGRSTSSFLRGLTIGAILGAIVAGSSLWSRWRRSRHPGD